MDAPASRDTTKTSDAPRPSATLASGRDVPPLDHAEWAAVLHTELASIVLERAIATLRRLVANAPIEILRKALASETGLEGLAVLVGEHRLAAAAASHVEPTGRAQ